MRQLSTSLAASAGSLIRTKQINLLDMQLNSLRFRCRCVQGSSDGAPVGLGKASLRSQAGCHCGVRKNAICSCRAAVSPFRNLSRERHLSFPPSVD